MDTLSFLSYLSNFVYPGIPFFIGIFRWKLIDKEYIPLILIMGCAFFNELFRFLQRVNYVYDLEWPIGSSLISYNIYVLVISILYLFLFKNLGVFYKYRLLYIILIITLSIFWLVDHFFIPGNNIFGVTKYFRIFYSFMLCLLAIQKINMLLVSKQTSLIKNSAFLVCIAILFFFLPYIVTECITFFLKNYSVAYLQAVFNFRKFSLPIIYFIYTLAVLWIPPKKLFIQLS